MRKQKARRNRKSIDWAERRNTLAIVVGRRAIDPVEQAQRRDCARRVRGVLAQMPSCMAKVLTTCDMEGLPLRTLGKPVKLCRERKEARKVFKKLWEQRVNA